MVVLVSEIGTRTAEQQRTIATSVLTANTATATATATAATNVSTTAATLAAHSAMAVPITMTVTMTVIHCTVGPGACQACPRLLHHRNGATLKC